MGVFDIERKTVSFENRWFTVKYERRFKSNFMGRFGGGWNWKLGVQVGATTWIFNLLIATVRVNFKKRST